MKDKDKIKEQLIEELEKEKATLDNIINLNPYSISIYDAEGHFVRGNQAYRELFKSTPRQTTPSSTTQSSRRPGILKNLILGSLN